MVIQLQRCPACNVPLLGRPSHTYTVDQAAAHFCSPDRGRDRYERMLAVLKRLWGSDTCDVMHCGECGFGFTRPYVGGDEEFYAILHEEHGYPRWRWDYDVAMRFAINPRLSGRVLDIGAGDGAFLRGIGGAWDKSAIEASDTTREVLCAGGIRVYDTLSEAIREGASFDIITMFQVLEHIAPFEQVLCECRTLLRSQGRLVITVPDAKAMIMQEMLTGCADMPPNHVNKWTVRSLTLTLGKAGFSVREVLEEPPSLAKLRSVVHLCLLADRVRPGTMAQRAYRIRSRPLRFAALLLLSGPALLRVAPHLGTLTRGGAFAIVAS